VKDWAPTWAEDKPDYLVRWEVRVEPVMPEACPFDVWFVEAGNSGLCCAFGFDSVELLAERLNLKPLFGRRTIGSNGFFAGKFDVVYVFGFEPISLRREQLHAIVRATFEGQLEVKYFAAFGYLLSYKGGLTVDVGVPHVRRRLVGKSYRYAPYVSGR